MRRASPGILAALASLALGAAPALAGNVGTDSVQVLSPPTTASSPCSSPEAHQFDFWLGDWEVTNPKGAVAGTNRVIAVLGGCAIQENWKGARGMSGTSLNMYIPSTGTWHQTWIDDHGTLLLLDGRFQGGKMVLSGQTPDPKSAGGVALQRITWSPLPGGNVRQLWETSADAGKTWTVAFDGTYRRKP